MQAVLLPPPYNGENYQFPTISIQNPFCRKMLNYNNKGGSLNVRQGNSYFATLGQGDQAAYGIASYNGASPKLFVVSSDGVETFWFDVTSGGTGTEVHSIGPSGSDQLIATLYFNNYLFFFGIGNLNVDDDGPQYYNGSAWGAATYTWAADFDPFGGDVHKNRGYIIGYNSAKYSYTAVDSFSGATTQVDLGGVISTKAELYIIRSISMSQSVTQENVLAFIFSSGEVIVYSGSYPNSPDWGANSRFTISKPLFYNSYVNAKGDSFVFTQSEVLSLRNLFIGGYEKERQEGIGAAIQKRYEQIVSTLIGAGVDLVDRALIRGVYDEKENRLIISFPLYVNPVTGETESSSAFFLIYDFTLRGWYEYKQDRDAGELTFPIPVYHANQVYFVTTKQTDLDAFVFLLEGAEDFMDESPDGGDGISIAFDLETAPLPISKFGSSEISGVEVISKSDLYPQTNYKFIADLGRQETGAQNLSAQGSDVARPQMNVGIQGAIVAQLSIYGSTVPASVGLELYGFNIWYNKGAEGSR